MPNMDAGNEKKNLSIREMEFGSLRADIRQNNNIMHGLLAVLLASVGAVSGIVFTTDEPLLFVVVFLIIIPVVAKTSLLLHSNMLIAKYIKENFEPPGRWETYYSNNLCEMSRCEKIMASLVTSNVSNTFVAVVVFFLFLVKLFNTDITLYSCLGVAINLTCLVLIVAACRYDLRRLFGKNEKKVVSHGNS
jgi:hypothetical protein